MFRKKAMKRTWSDVREPDAPVPDTHDGLQKAIEASDKSRAGAVRDP
jgi:hypothetical protein